MKYVGAALAIGIFISLGVAFGQSLSFNFSLDSIPNVSSVSISLGTDTATIDWMTNVPTDSQVEYGTSTSYGSSTTLDTNMGLGHSVSITGLSSNTLYYFRILSADSNGLMQPYTGSFTTLASSSSPPPPPPPPGGSTGGSSGGSSSSGGGGSTTAVNSPVSSSVPVDKIIMSAPTLSKDASFTLRPPSGFHVKSVSVRSLETVTGFRVEITKISSPNVPTPIGKLYTYLRIDAYNYSNLTSIEVEFDVPKSWVESNGLTFNDIRLLRYSDKWLIMPTVLSGTNATHYTFRSSLPGFSVFAIVGDQEISQIEENQSEGTTGASELLAPFVSKTDSQYPLPMQYFIISGFMFIIAIILYIVHRRHGHHDDEPHDDGGYKLGF